MLKFSAYGLLLVLLTVPTMASAQESVRDAIPDLGLVDELGVEAPSNDLAADAEDWGPDGEWGTEDDPPVAGEEAAAAELPAQAVVHAADQFGHEEPSVPELEAHEEHVEAAHGEEGAHGAAAAHEEHGEHDEHGAHGFDAREFGGSVLNFFLWLAILIYIGRKPLTAFLKTRRAAVEDGIEEAKKMQAAAQKKYEEYSARLEKMGDELAKLRDEMVQAGEAERDRIIAEAEERAARMRRDAKFMIEQQVKQLRRDLSKEAAEAAVRGAEEALAKQLKPNDQQKLADNYLGQLEAAITEQNEVQA